MDSLGSMRSCPGQEMRLSSTALVRGARWKESLEAEHRVSGLLEQQLRPSLAKELAIGLPALGACAAASGLRISTPPKKQCAPAHPGRGHLLRLSVGAPASRSLISAYRLGIRGAFE